MRNRGLIAVLAVTGSVFVSAATAAPTPRTVSCNAQWQPVQTYDHSQQYGEIDSLNAVAAVSPGDQWAVGSWMQYPDAYDFHTLVEHWDGTSGAWTLVSSPNAGRLNNYLYGVDAAAPDDVWAVGGSDESGPPYSTLVEHWDGASWSIVPEASVFGVLYAVDALAPDDVWAVGTEGYPGPGVIEHWNGTSWTELVLPFGAVLRGVAALGPTDVWAVGQRYGDPNPYGDTTLTMHYDGTAWSEVPSPNPLTNNENDQNWLTSVSAVSANNVWAVGRYGDHDGGPLDETLIEHWNGSEWSVVKSPSPGGSSADDDLWGVVPVSPSDAWAVGGVGYFLDPEFSSPLLLHWNGSSWSSISASTSAPMRGELLGVAAEPAGTGISAVGDRLAPAQPYPYIGTLSAHLCPG
jgi:hypothetical protein